jgi:hypothetical protein
MDTSNSKTTHDILRLAQDSLQAWEHAALPLIDCIEDQANFDAKQAQLRLHLSACIDCRRAAVAGERTAVALENIAAALLAVAAAVGEAADTAELDASVRVWGA